MQWQLNFPSVASWLTKQGDNKVLSCVDCGFSISSITFSGKIVVDVKEGVLSIQSAELTPGITAVASMVMRLQSDADWSGSWDYIFDSVPLSSIAVDSAFSIKPTVFYSIGADFSTDSAVDVTAGARFSLSKAAATLDLLADGVTSSQNWTPAVSYTLPAFKTGASVSVTPYVRWIVSLEVNLYDMINITPSLVSETVVGLKSKYSFSAGTYNCPANTLAVNTYVNFMYGISPGDGTVLSLYNAQSAGIGQCFGVPAAVPSPDEMQTLSAVGGPFCTSYINYQVPTTTSYSTRTVVVPSSTVTAWATTTVVTAKTIVETTNLSYDTWTTSTAAAVTVTVTASGKSVNFPAQNAKRDLAEPTAAPAPVERRAVATPAVAAGWDATKMSYACKQIATGQSTLTRTVPLTISSGITTTTSTMTSNLMGPVVTQRTTSTWTRDMGVTTITTARTATKTALPPSSTNSCFKIKVVNLPWAQGKYLHYMTEALSLDALNFNGTVFYLSNTGKLVTYDWSDYLGRPGFLGTLPYFINNADYGAWMYNANSISQFAAANNPNFVYMYATCKKDADPCSRGLTCSLGSYSFLSLGAPDYMPLGKYVQGGAPAWIFLKWGQPTNLGITYYPLQLEYENVPCPAL